MRKRIHCEIYIQFGFCNINIWFPIFDFSFGMKSVLIYQNNKNTNTHSVYDNDVDLRIRLYVKT